MANEGNGKGFGAAFTRLYHYMQNGSTALKWNLIELFSPHKQFGPDEIPKRSGDVAVVTGGSRGIGADIVKKMLQADMHVFIGCRNIDTGNKLVKRLREIGVTTGLAECIHLDLTSLDSVRKFVKSVLEINLPIHILINNAGIMWSPYEVTPDGFESQFQVNYLGHFLLINLLLPSLVKSGREGKVSRIINLSSIAQYGGDIQFDNLQMKKNYSPARAYQNSKLMVVVMSNYLDAKFKSNKSNVASFSVHPGVIITDLYTHVPGISLVKGFMQMLTKTSEEGADGVVYAAFSPYLEGKGGQLLANSEEIPQIEQALNSEVQEKLWNASCEMAGIKKDHLKTLLSVVFLPTQLPKEMQSSK